MHQLQHFTLNSSLSWRWAAEIGSLIFDFLRKLPFVFHNSTFGSLLSLFLTGCNFAQIANNVVDHGQVFRELRTAWNIVHVESFPILPALSHIWQLKIKIAPSLLTPWLHNRDSSLFWDIYWHNKLREYVTLVIQFSSNFLLKHLGFGKDEKNSTKSSTNLWFQFKILKRKVATHLRGI